MVTPLMAYVKTIGIIMDWIAYGFSIICGVLRKEDRGKVKRSSR